MNSKWAFLTTENRALLDERRQRAGKYRELPKVRGFQGEENGKAT